MGLLLLIKFNKINNNKYNKNNKWNNNTSHKNSFHNKSKIIIKIIIMKSKIKILMKIINKNKKRKNIMKKINANVNLVFMKDINNGRNNNIKSKWKNIKNKWKITIEIIILMMILINNITYNNKWKVRSINILHNNNRNGKNINKTIINNSLLIINKIIININNSNKYH